MNMLARFRGSPGLADRRTTLRVWSGPSALVGAIAGLELSGPIRTGPERSGVPEEGQVTWLTITPRCIPRACQEFCVRVIV